MNASTFVRMMSWIVAAALLATGVARAGAPWAHAVPFKWVEADPDKTYDLTENNGPWLILAATFRGPAADEDSRALVYELRKKHKLQAYTYRKGFDFTEKVEGRGVDKYGDVKRMKNQNAEKVTEIAVLVGDYQTVDDKQGQKILKSLKYMRPVCLEPKKDKQSSQALADVRAFYKSFLPADSDRAMRGPMGNAFVITNPLLPKEYFAPKGLDPLVEQMNKGVKYSLLDCKKKYTVKIATFNGAVLIDQKMVKAAEDGTGTFKSQLEGAADKAHSLTEALRAKGVEAYEYHDRYSSIVTVGNFDSVGSPRDDGKIEINPAIHAIIKTYGANTENLTAGSEGIKAKNLKVGSKAIPFDVSPMPVEIPRRSLSADYGRTAAFAPR